MPKSEMPLMNPSVKSGLLPTTTSRLLTMVKHLLFLTVLLFSLCLLGCWQTCQVCPPSPIALPTVPSPYLRPIDATVRGGDYCLSDTARRSLLVDVELLRAFGMGNLGIIEEWNKSLKVKP